MLGNVHRCLIPQLEGAFIPSINTSFRSSVSIFPLSPAAYSGLLLWQTGQNQLLHWRSNGLSLLGSFRGMSSWRTAFVPRGMLLSLQSASCGEQFAVSKHQLMRNPWHRGWSILFGFHWLQHILQPHNNMKIFNRSMLHHFLLLSLLLAFGGENGPGCFPSFPPADEWCFLCQYSSIFFLFFASHTLGLLPMCIFGPFCHWIISVNISYQLNRILCRMKLDSIFFGHACTYMYIYNMHCSHV